MNAQWRTKRQKVLKKTFMIAITEAGVSWMVQKNSDFSTFDDPALVRYAVDADGAYAESAFSALAKRFDDHPLDLIKTIADENLGFSPASLMDVCRGLAREYIMEQRADEVNAVINNLLGASRPSGVDQRAFSVAEAIQNQMYYLTTDITLPMGTVDNGADISRTGNGFTFTLTNVEICHSDVEFDANLNVIYYNVYTVGPGAELTIIELNTSTELFSGTPYTYCLNYGCGLGDPGNTLVGGSMTVPVTADLRGIMRVEDGLPVLVFNIP